MKKQKIKKIIVKLENYHCLNCCKVKKISISDIIAIIGIVIVLIEKLFLN